MVFGGQDPLLGLEQSQLFIRLGVDRAVQQPSVSLTAGGDSLAVTAKPVELGRHAGGVEAQHPSVGDHTSSGGGVGQLAHRPGQQAIDAPVQPDRDRVTGLRRGRSWDAPRQIHSDATVGDSKGGYT
jgi:hypothetical protein